MRVRVHMSDYLRQSVGVGVCVRVIGIEDPGRGVVGDGKEFSWCC